MSDYADFLPRMEKLKVGEADLEVNEFTIAKRDAVLKLILSGLDVATVIRPFLDAAKRANENVENLVPIFSQLKDLLLQLLGNDLTIISCVTLDTPANRKKVAVLISDPKVEETVANDKFGYTYSLKMHAWLKENLTTRQEFHLIESVLKINDFVGLVKNYVTLATGTLRAAREKDAATKE